MIEIPVLQDEGTHHQRERCRGPPDIRVYSVAPSRREIEVVCHLIHGSVQNSVTVELRCFVLDYAGFLVVGLY